MRTVFIRLLREEEAKGESLKEEVEKLRNGKPSDVIFVLDPSVFRQIEGSPFAYWVSDRIRRLFTELPPFESEGRTAKQGLATADDFRFVRAWWEVAPERILDGRRGPDWREDLKVFQDWCRERTFQGKRWVPFAKGGEYSPYYADLHLVVNWERDGEELREFENAYIRNEGSYFRPGLTWPRRTQKGLNIRVLSAGAIFADKGPSVFTSLQALLTLLGLTNSKAFIGLVELQMVFGSYEVGVIQRTPIPDALDSQRERLAGKAMAMCDLKRKLDTANETNHLFTLPALLQTDGETLEGRASAWFERIREAEEELERIQREIDEIAYQLYKLTEEDRRAIELTLKERKSQEKQQVALGPDLQTLVADLISYAVGAAFGRWDIRYATGEKESPELPDPFDPLPVCSRGMLQDENGLPLKKTPEGYPIEVPWDGILVDDEGHTQDIVACVREVLEIIFGEKAETIEEEACEILRVKSLRDYFRRPGKGGFWEYHLKRYSKSRRKAPIYWLLQSSKKNYALWIYYHRLDKDTLYKALVNYVEPKIRLEERRLQEMNERRRRLGTGGREVKRLERGIARQEAFVSELYDFRDKLKRVAELNLEPDLDDGVLLNIAPLHELVPWKEAKKAWQELEEGKYAWSSIARQLRERGVV
ncbi:MAG TPA: hypothetical protein ENF46_01970 [Candidatus Acetothermia bacterium]|nr:hypothetical protein [Candidatus Acetothermia bacterium]